MPGRRHKPEPKTQTEDSSPAEILKKFWAPLASFLGAVTVIVQFIQLWNGNRETVTWATVALGGCALFIGLLYIGFSRKSSPIYPSNRIPSYPRFYKLARLGLILSLLAMIVAGVVISQQNKGGIDKTVILVANIDGPDPQKYRVTDLILARLSQSLAPYTDIEVKSLGHSITEADGSTVARTEGDKQKAAIVIWGWYGVTSQAAIANVHFEILRSTTFPGIKLDTKGPTQTHDQNSMESFVLQTRLSEEMAYLSLFAVGTIRYVENDWDGAISRFSDALNQTSEPASILNPSVVYLYRGNAYSRKQNYIASVADYTQAIQLQSNLADAYLARGRDYRSQGNTDRSNADLDAAIKLYAQFIASKPNCSPCVYVNRGNAYKEQGDYDRAFSDYSEAIKIDSKTTEAYIGRGIIYSSHGETDRSIADYTQAVSLRPDDPLAYNLRGLGYLSKGDSQKAIADLNRAIELKPQWAESYVTRSVIHIAAGNYDLAVADLNHAISLNSVDAFIPRGFIYAIKGDYDRAISDYNQALKLKPSLSQDSFYRSNAANAYAKRALRFFDVGNYDRAIDDSNKAIQLQADSFEAYGNRGLAFLLTGQYDHAIADFNKVIILRPENLTSYLNRGLAYLYKGNPDQTIADCNYILDRDPGDADAYYNRGRAYKAKGEKEKAIADLKKALELNKDPNSRKPIEDHLKELGQ